LEISKTVSEKQSFASPSWWTQ